MRAWRQGSAAAQRWRALEGTPVGTLQLIHGHALSRNPALRRRIMAQWRQCSDLAPPETEPPAQEEANGGLTARTQSVKRLLRGMSSLVLPRSSDEPQEGDDGLQTPSLGGACSRVRLSDPGATTARYACV